MSYATEILTLCNDVCVILKLWQHMANSSAADNSSTVFSMSFAVLRRRSVFVEMLIFNSNYFAQKFEIDLFYLGESQTNGLIVTY